ncbi:unnamed protein product [Rodentolepis nana]|uniref:Plasma membrane fusion protein PRM1 n=1 Tax=Rodentolepis nana TaxID=102285 RepID=A0A0R3TMV1_RODNA|nr:unnamed protein product [Rodentolepis nana]
MEAFYHAATGVVNTAQRNLDGGIFTFILDRQTDSPEITQSIDDSIFYTHFINKISSGGFLAGIFFGLLWCICLLAGFFFIWWLRCRKTSPLSTLRLMKHQSSVESGKSNNIELPKKSKLFLRRRRLQSNWLCIAFQCCGFSTLVGFLLIFSILGFVTSYSLHTSLTTESPSFSHTQNLTFISNNWGLYPGVSSALQSVRNYSANFLDNVRVSTAPAVDNLIQATMEMQNQTTIKVNDLLHSMLGIDRAFDLADKVGSHTVKLLNLVNPLKNYINEYTDAVSSLSMAIARWNGYMEQLHGEKNLSATKVCDGNATCVLPVLSGAEVTVNSNWRLSRFDFAIALNFVTDAQNRTPEVIKEQLTSARQIASKQLDKTFEKMRAEIDIPGSLRNMTERNWFILAEKLKAVNTIIDSLSEFISSKIFPITKVGSNYNLAICCLIWLFMLGVVLALSVLLYHYHCTNSTIESRNRKKIRCVSSFLLIILILCIFVSCVLFLVSGYAYTEICRYVSPDRAVLEYSFDKKSGKYQESFVLDTYINSYLDQNWNTIVEKIKTTLNDSESEEMPIPRIRSPIYALNVACKNNAGILDAFGAVDNFNYSALNKPELTQEFVEKGRKIMRETLVELNVTEMFPPDTTESIQLGSRLDDFLIPFDKARQELPWDFLNVTSRNKTLLMTGTDLSALWKDYYAFLSKGNLAVETLERADELANIVFNLSAEITKLLESVDGILQGLENITKIGPTALELQSIYDNLMDQVRNREDLIVKALNLYDTHVAKELPQKSNELIRKYGPALLREVGRCRNLHDAYSSGVAAVCDSVIEPLNGVWFFAGLCILISTILITLGLLFLLHKIPPFPHAVAVDVNEPLCIAPHEQSFLKPGENLTSVNGVRIVQPPGIHSLIRGQHSRPQTPTSQV